MSTVTDLHPDLIDLAHEVARVFELLEIPYFITGSVGSSLVGEHRLTNDIDVVAGVSSLALPSFIRQMGEGYYVSHGAATRAVDTGGSFNLIHIATAQKIDIFVPPDTAFEREQMNRRRALKVKDGVELFVATPEDILLSKLRWFKKGGGVSERQWRDVLGVLKVQRGSLDRSYLHRWAEQLDLVDLLERALKVGFDSSI